MTPASAYLQAARAAGAEAEVVPSAALAERLAALAAELGTPSVALPLRGWPEGLLKTVKEALREGGCPLVSPTRNGEDWSWDRAALAEAGIGVTWCPACLADTGTLVFPSGAGLGTLASLLPPVHLALSTPDAVLADLGAYLSALGPALPSRLTLVTGPSRTGDIEGTLTAGVHGPGRVIHWLVEG